MAPTPPSKTSLKASASVHTSGCLAGPSEHAWGREGVSPAECQELRAGRGRQLPNARSPPSVCPPAPLAPGQHPAASWQQQQLSVTRQQRVVEATQAALVARGLDPGQVGEHAVHAGTNHLHSGRSGPGGQAGQASRRRPRRMTAGRALPGQRGFRVFVTPEAEMSCQRVGRRSAVQEGRHPADAAACTRQHPPPRRCPGTPVRGH